MEFSIGAVIGVAGASLVVGAVIMNYLYNKFGVKPLYPSGPKTPIDLSILNWFKVLYYFLPYGLFLFGVIYDGLIRKVKFFPAGFVGLINVYLNSTLSYLITKTASDDADICGIPGMSKWGSGIAPQNMLFSSTVLSYIASYITASQTDSWYSGVAWIGMFAVWLVQLIGYYTNKCYDNRPIAGWVFPLLGSITPPLYALAGGMLIGGLAGFGFSKLQGDDAGIGISSEAKQSLGKSGGPALAPTSGTAGAGKCSPTNSDDAFVCEAYKNGELVTSTIVE